MKDKNSSNLELLRNVGKSKGVLGRMFSWSWNNQQLSPIIKIHSSERSAGQYNIICLNNSGVEVWNSSSNTDEVKPFNKTCKIYFLILCIQKLQQDINLRTHLEEQVKSPIQFLDCHKFKYVAFISSVLE